MAEVVDIIHKLTFEVDADPAKQLTKEFGTQLKEVDALQKEIVDLNAILSKTAKDDIRAQREINAQLDIRKRKLDSVTGSIAKQVDGSQRLTRAVKALEVNTNGVGIAFSNIVRDAPFGIIGIGNNITQAYDSATLAFKQLRAQGLTTGQAFAQIGSSLLSLNTLISVGVTALTVLSMQFNKTSKDADKAKTSIDSVGKAIDDYAKMFKDVANFNDEGTNALKRNAEAIKAQGVAAGEVFESEKNIFNAEQQLRRQEQKDIENRIKLYERVSAAMLTGRGDPATRAERFSRNIAGFPQATREELQKAYNEGTLTRRSINERINQLNEEAKNKYNEIVTSEIEFNSQQREKEYQLRVKLTERLSELEIEYAKLRVQRGKETFDRIQETNALELRENEEKLNREIEDARKAGTLSLQVQQRFEQIRFQIRKQANEKLLQENLEYFQQEREDLQEVVNGLGNIFNTDRPDALNKISFADEYSKAVSDEINRGLKKDEDRRKEEKEMIKDYLDYTIQTTAQTLQTIYEMQAYYLDKEIALRQERVAKAVELAEKGNTDILESERAALIEAQNERDRVGQRQLQLNALLQASSAAIAAVQAIQTVTNAGATGDPYTAAARIAAAVAALAAGFAFVTNLTQAFKANSFKDGVIGIDGAGTETSDSIPARLSKGESVMTAKETKKYKEYLLAMRDGSFDKMLKTHEPVYIGGGNNYKPLEKKLDSVIYAIESNKVVAKQTMDKNGISQAIDTYRKHERQRFIR